jgi:two-component system alkaline phosphatase synthesis response regulator PhoP
MSHKIKILIVDDEPDVLEILRYNLEKENYLVFSANNGQQAIEMAKKIHPALIILDVMMPGKDGIETCRELREISDLQDVIITFLTARNEDYSQIAGLDAGSDDYIAKPIKPRLLISRIHALLRRFKKIESDNLVIEYQGIILNRTTYSIDYSNQNINLPKKEFELLSLLMSNPKKVFTREQILDIIWGTETIVGDRTIDVHIRKLRERFPELNIQTIKGIGYSLQ